MRVHIDEIFGDVVEDALQTVLQQGSQQLLLFEHTVTLVLEGLHAAIGEQRHWNQDQTDEHQTPSETDPSCRSLVDHLISLLPSSVFNSGQAVLNLRYRVDLDKGFLSARRSGTAGDGARSIRPEPARLCR